MKCSRDILTRYGIALCFALCVLWVAVCYHHNKAHPWNERAVLGCINRTSDMIDLELDTLKKEAMALATLMPHEDDSCFSMRNFTDIMQGFMLRHTSVESIMLGLQTELCDTMGEYFPLLLRQSGEIREVRLPAGKHQLIRHYESDWYAGTLTGGKPRLSKPFHLGEAGQVCSYCIPIRQDDNTVYAVLALNCPMQKIASRIKDSLQDKGARIMLTGQDHVILTSTSDTGIGDTLFSLMEQEGWEFDLDTYDRLNWKQPGMLSYKANGQQRYLYYRPHEVSGWIILMDAAF